MSLKSRLLGEIRAHNGQLSLRRAEYLFYSGFARGFFAGSIIGGLVVLFMMLWGLGGGPKWTW